MEYNKENIKEGLNLHIIKTNKFKTNLIAVFLTTPITKQNVTKDALISLILRRGTKNMKIQEEISIELENMYGASFDCGVDKIGDNHVFKFYLESINDEYLPKKENLLEESINKILEITFNPLIENEKFKDEYFNGEKEKLKRIINGKIDNKGMYAFNRCIEEMYKNKPYGLYKYGYIEDLDKIKNEELYKYYLELVQKCKIDIFVSGNIESNIKEIVENNEQIKKINKQEVIYIKNSEDNTINEKKQIDERMDIAQGKLVIGLNINSQDKDIKNAALVYNGILGGTANSKLFQNVREKESLAYTAASNYVRQKNAIFIRCGIEVENYNKVVEIIHKQLEDMKNGKFTQEEIDNTKEYIKSTIIGIPDEQDIEISYYLGQELTNSNTSIDEYIENIENITKEELVEIGNLINVDTIYFLKNN